MFTFESATSWFTATSIENAVISRNFRAMKTVWLVTEHADVVSVTEYSELDSALRRPLDFQFPPRGHLSNSLLRRLSLGDLQ